MRLLGSSAAIFVVILFAWLLPHSVSANPIEPVRTFNLQAQVGARETIAATAIGDDKLYFLITDQSPTGRSAILLETDPFGTEQRWQDLKVAAHALVKAGDFIGAVAPIPGGLRVLEPTAGEVRTTDLSGRSANVTGVGSQLLRVLGTGDLAVHSISGHSIGEPRTLSTSMALRTLEACATCGPNNTVAPGAYVVCPLPGNRLAVVISLI